MLLDHLKDCPTATDLTTFCTCKAARKQELISKMYIALTYAKRELENKNCESYVVKVVEAALENYDKIFPQPQG